MKANAKELFEVVRAVVREEVKKVLPQMVREHLTESYIKRMVLEAAMKGPAKSGNSLAELLAPTSQVDEDEIPHPQPNTDMGIYAASNLVNPELNRPKKNESKRPVNEGVQKLRKELGAMAFVLDDVQVPRDEKEEVAGPGIQFKEEQIAPQFERMNKLLEAMETKSGSKKEMSAGAEAKMRELEMRRKALEVPVRK